MQVEPENEAEPATEPVEEELEEELEAAEPETPNTDEEQLEEPESESQPDESPADEQPDSPEPEPAAPEEIPHLILQTARAAMGVFTETWTDAYVARLEASPSEWMTITDDSLSNELERELLTSAAAMCFWQELMIWYQGGRTSAFTDAFGRDRSSLCPRAGGPMAHRVQAQIDTETLVGIIARPKRVLVFFHLLEGGLRLAGALQLSTEHTHLVWLLFQKQPVSELALSRTSR